jgi:ribosomal protein S18 acetylase RimI-like enzyme
MNGEKNQWLAADQDSERDRQPTTTEMRFEMSATNGKLPVGFEMRPACLEDIPAVTEMMNESSRQLYGVDQFEAEEFVTDLQAPGFNMETDTLLVTNGDGRPVGYYEVWDLLTPSVRVNLFGATHPEYEGLGIGSALLAWAEQRAYRAVLRAPQEARVVIQGVCAHHNQRARQLFLDHGFQEIRHFYRMVIDLDQAPAPLEWPAGIHVVNYAEQIVDLADIVHAVRDSFKDHFNYVESSFEEELSRWQHHVLENPEFDPSLWFVALDEDQVAGISLCWPKADANQDMGWVSTLGVRRAWRKRGLGLALLLHSFSAFSQRGKRQVGLGVDASSLTGATRLYEKAGMRPDPKYQLDMYEKELRPGVELSRRSLEP